MALMKRLNLEKSLKAKALPLIKGTAGVLPWFIVGHIFRKKTYTSSVLEGKRRSLHGGE